MSQEEILKLIEKKGIMTYEKIAESLKLSKSSVLSEIKRLENYGEIFSFVYSSQNWKVYCSKEVFEGLNGLHKIRGDTIRQRERDGIQFHNK